MNVFKLRLSEKSKVKNRFNTPSSSLNDESYIEQEMLLKRLAAPSVEDGESLWLLSYSDMMTLLFGFFVLLMSFSKIDVEAFEKVKKETTTLFGGEYQKPFQKMQDELKDQVKLQGVSDKALFNEFEKGLTITFRGSVFFDSGSADLKPEAISLLKKVIPVVKKQNAKFNVVVEGHTDDSPIQSEKFPSNWELSSHRASAVLRLFEENGFQKNNLRAIGFADTLPVLPNRDVKNQVIPDNQSQNRRIVLKLVRANQK